MAPNRSSVLAEADRFQICLADDVAQVRALQRLRYQIFAEEMGAEIVDHEGLDRDPFDRHCQHLYVIDRDNGQLVGGTRLLNRAGAKNAGGFYSQGEFLMDTVLQLTGEMLEVGRTCIHPDYRDGSGIALLWQGLAALFRQQQVKHLFGCASVPLRGDSTHVHALMRRLRDSYQLPESLAVKAVNPTPAVGELTNIDLAQITTIVPPLLKAYLRLGARIGAEPCWDEQFGCADLFVLLDVSELNERYARHFRAR
ncbi:GNAT family N-acetyltransferase [Permianibacter sp. IMCC34836]|uniref:GNAT family N-acetyltransferase n=1 Tax=Permianibacter fluminis TaxID=2738515 RepID=UPI001551FCD2|nr:GNAT family N-acyltransferase [Permianibacter fluminis]NQD36929.1 GNAT family N-acetyltransferase [Permianibacter fluminis]